MSDLIDAFLTFVLFIKITIFGYFSLGDITPSFINLYKDNKSVIVTANGVKNIDSS
ncbi:hypothetical protein HMPREF0495_01982 [Levilactobacillus brevis ATCC 14869 = DSM 20054]|uniref:Uncharacterized protein n=1 Tax=Levilactobacillus brevis ATCC 14869 = DSM 20054 TaxID=649758 RepID=U2QLM8_LEVBR|nr:hypothetical protein HMPREF0495_01982 [Levilactobacillus brevis ATCC 14869 = DSM 20054]